MTRHAIKVLIVDDELTIRQAVRTSLGALGFDTGAARSAEEALDAVQEQVPNVVLTDMNMPGMGGLAACREMRRLFPTIGIIMLTVRDSQRDKIEALDAGADDYVVKPFTVGELAARLRALARRGNGAAQAPPPVLKVGEIELDLARRSVRKGPRTLHLTPTEFELLHLLMRRAGTPVTHADLLRAVWGVHFSSHVEYLRTFMNQLRKKVEDDPGNPVYLLTQPFVGYLFKKSGA